VAHAPISSPLPPSDIPLLQYHVTRWPQLDEVRRSAGGRHDRWRHALTGLPAGARTELLGAVYAGQARLAGPPRSASEDIPLSTALLYGTLRFEALTLLRDGGLTTLGNGWSWPEDRIAEALHTILGLIGAGPALFDDAPAVGPHSARPSSNQSPPFFPTSPRSRARPWRPAGPGTWLWP
jgi:hypothetical protein